MKNRCSALHVAPNIALYHVGPALDHGPLPSLFYFALAGPDSLCLDPYNQPVQFLQGSMIRIFSMTLPGHESNLPATEALKIWADDLKKGHNLIEKFLEEAEIAIAFAIREKFVNPAKMAIGGLSRGGFIAAHLAAREERFRHLVGFAPLTRLGKISEFQKVQELKIVHEFDLIHLAEKLSDRHIKLYIGNEDRRVGTRECFEFAMALVAKKKMRSSLLELSIYPSIGQKGHGTPPEIFQQGAQWIRDNLQIQ